MATTANTTLVRAAWLDARRARCVATRAAGSRSTRPTPSGPDKTLAPHRHRRPRRVHARVLPGVESPWSPSGQDMDAVIDELTARAAAAAFYGDGDGSARVFIGVVGSPGSGKSTLAAAVCRRLNAAAGADVAVVFPMDGFHYYRAQLDEFPDPEEARRRRGSPFTFDAEAFVSRVRATKTNLDDVTLVPAFDHEVHDPEEDAIAISPSHKVVIVEGNYLLLAQEPWRRLWVDGDGDEEEALLSETWFVDTSVDAAMERVVRRHVAVGRTPEEAKRRADGNDRPNGELVWANREAADVIVPSYKWRGERTGTTSYSCPRRDDF